MQAAHASWRRIALGVLVLSLAIVGLAWRMQPVTQPSPSLLHGFSRVTLERTGCFGNCPIYEVTVERDGEVMYRAKHGPTRRQVQWQTQVPAASLQALVSAIESPSYQALAPDYSNLVTDLPSTTLTVEGPHMYRRTHVYAVPCRKAQAAGKDLRGSHAPVPDIFCSVVELLDVASCARYWGKASSPADDGRAAVLPYRCTVAMPPTMAPPA